MTKSRGNFHYNYPRVTKYLDDNDILFEEFSDGQHLRIMGDTMLFDLWPSKMTYHIIDSEDVIPSKYSGWKKLNYYFDPEQFEKFMNWEL